MITFQPTQLAVASFAFDTTKLTASFTTLVTFTISAPIQVRNVIEFPYYWSGSCIVLVMLDVFVISSRMNLSKVSLTTYFDVVAQYSYKFLFHLEPS